MSTTESSSEVFSKMSEDNYASEYEIMSGIKVDDVDDINVPSTSAVSAAENMFQVTKMCMLGLILLLIRNG